MSSYYGVSKTEQLNFGNAVIVLHHPVDSGNKLPRHQFVNPDGGVQIRDPDVNQYYHDHANGSMGDTYQLELGYQDVIRHGSRVPEYTNINVDKIKDPSFKANQHLQLREFFQKQKQESIKEQNKIYKQNGFEEDEINEHRKEQRKNDIKRVKIIKKQAVPLTIARDVVVEEDPTMYPYDGVHLKRQAVRRSDSQIQNLHVI